MDVKLRPKNIDGLSGDNFLFVIYFFVPGNFGISVEYYEPAFPAAVCFHIFGGLFQSFL